MSGWQIDQAKLDQVGQLLTACQDVSNHEAHLLALKMLEEHTKVHPDFGCYLLVVFCKMPSAPAPLRHLAGIQLKNAIKERRMKEPELTYIRTEITGALGDSENTLRRTAAQIVTTICGRHDVPARIPNNQPLQDWDGLLPGLLQMLNSGSEAHVEGAMSTLRLLFEDHTDQLCVEGLAVTLQAIVARLVQLLQAPQARQRADAIYCVRMLILPMPNALVVHLNDFLRALLNLSKDPSPEVRKEICIALCILAACKADFLADPEIRSFVIEFMLWTTEKDDEYDVKKEACEFWQTVCESEEIPDDVLKPYLSRLTLVLLNGMVYSEDELIALEEEEQKNSAADVNPAMLHHQTKGTVVDEEEDEDEASDGTVEWTLRKCSALGLDVISTHYKNEILDALLPHIHAKLQSSDWMVQESAVLAMGALAEGCEEGLIAKDYLAAFITHLIQGILPSDKPLLRSITCWTLSRPQALTGIWTFVNNLQIKKHISQGHDLLTKLRDRYATYISNDPNGNSDAAGPLLQPMVQGVLSCMADSSSKVQEAAVSAMAVLEEEAGGKLIPHVLGILNVYAQALAHYKTKNLIILYDACGTLAEALGEELNKPELIAVLLPPLIAKWDAVPDEDKSLLPLLECMSYIVQALGMGFAQYAQPVMARCERIIAATLTAEQEYADEEFIVCALDLLSGLAGGLGGSMEALMSSNNSQVVPMLMQCLTHMMPDVRQSAFALLGDLAKSAITHLHPVLQPILQAVHANLDPEHLSVCNNACWSVGEITVRSDAAGMSGAVHELVVPLINILCRPRLHKSLLENAAITLGRFAMVCPDVVSQSLPNFIKPWCTVLTSIRDDIEKEHALRGMVKMAYLNPGTLVDSWPHVCEAINSWRVDIRAMSPDLMQEVTEMLRWFKSNLEGAGQWDACHGRTSMAAKHGLQHNFGLA